MGVEVMSDRQFRIVVALQVAVLIAVIATGIVILRSAPTEVYDYATVGNTQAIYDAVEILASDLDDVEREVVEAAGFAQDALAAAELAGSAAEDATSVAVRAADNAGDAADTAAEAVDQIELVYAFLEDICAAVNC